MRVHLNLDRIVSIPCTLLLTYTQLNLRNCSGMYLRYLRYGYHPSFQGPIPNCVLFICLFRNVICSGVSSLIGSSTNKSIGYCQCSARISYYIANASPCLNPFSSSKYVTLYVPLNIHQGTIPPSQMNSHKLFVSVSIFFILVL